MKNTTFLKFLEFPCSSDCVVSRGKDGFKLDFSKATAMDSGYSKTQSNAKSKGVISILMLLILFLFSNISSAQTITVDGNPIDWNLANYNTFPVKSYVLDAYGTGQVDNQFTGSKDFFLADGTGTGYLAWVIGQTKAKNDIANAAAVLNNGILYFAGDRTSNNGDAQIGFWFYLNGTAPRTLFTSPNAGGDFAPAHAVGDLLILADFTGGGGTATVSIYRWIGGGPPSAGSSVVPNTNGNLETTNLTGTVAINNNNVYPIPTGWSFLNPTYDTNEFYEGQVDLTSINLVNTCFSGFLLEARASQSVTASLDDFAGGLFNIRASVSMNDVTVCAGESATFTATATGGVAPLTYSFNGGPFTSSNTFTINPATSNTSVSVVVRGGAPNFCESLAVSANLTVNPVPTVTVNSPTKCSNDSAVTITATPSPAGSYNYVWTVPNGATNPGNVASFSASVNGTYSVVITTTDGTNCSGSGSGTLTVNPSPSLVTNNPAPVCAPLTVDLTLPAVTAGSNFQGGTLSYWTNSGATIPLNNPNAVSASGTYYIKVTTSANCTDIEPVTVTVIPVIPIVINCPQNSSTSACAYADQAAVISAFNNWLAGFTASGGNGTLVTSGLQNLTAPNLCAGGSVTVNFSASDDCGKQASCSATFTITAAPVVTVTSPDSSSTSACAYADQAAVNAAFATWLGGFTVSGGCAPSGSYGQVSAPSACGGTTTVTYTVTDKCYETTTVTRSFTITAAPALVLNSPDSTIIDSCAYADQAAVDAAFATWLSQFTVTGGCTPVGDYGQPVAPPLCSGGTTTVTYVVNDLCVEADVTETFTVVPALKLEVSCPADRVVECGDDAATLFAQWRDSFGYTGGCANATVTDLSQYQMPAPGVPLIITFTVTDNCQTVSCTARFFINECAYCTYTQGYYGNPKGVACTPEGTTTNARAIMINALTIEEGEYDFGSIVTGNYFKLTLADVTSNNIFRMLPGGGTPRSLIGYATYSVASTWSDNDPLNASGSQRGKINNNLLSQTMTLFFNTRLNSEIGDFALTNTFVTADTEVCGSSEPMPGTEQLFTIAQPVIDYLDANGGATVSNLFLLANKALGGENIGNVTASQVNGAVDAINRGFDGCRVFVGTTMTYETVETTIRQDSQASSTTKGMDVKIYPNPYTDNFNVSLSTSNDDKVAIAVYDMIGRLIETRDVNPRESSDVRIGDKYPSGVYNVVVTQGEEVKTLKVIKR